MGEKSLILTHVELVQGILLFNLSLPIVST